MSSTRDTAELLTQIDSLERRIVELERTAHNEVVAINRRAAESDLLIYVNINLVPMDGGHKSVGTGLTNYESLRAHHNPQTIRDTASYMEPSKSKLHASTERIGRAMLHVVRHGDERKLLESHEIEALVGRLGAGHPRAEIEEEGLVGEAVRSGVWGWRGPAHRFRGHAEQDEGAVAVEQVAETVSAIAGIEGLDGERGQHGRRGHERKPGSDDVRLALHLAIVRHQE